MSVAAHEAIALGQPVLIEHVMPQRAFAQKVIEQINEGATDEQLVRFIQDTYRLVLLTTDETRALNRQNRSRITRDRLADAGIRLYEPKVPPVG